MAKIIGLTHTSGKIIRVLKFIIGGSDVYTGSPQNDAIVELIVFKNQDWEDRYKAGTLDPDFEKVGTRRFTKNNILDVLTQFPDGSLNDGDRIRYLIYNYVKNKLGDGWDFEYEI